MSSRLAWVRTHEWAGALCAPMGGAYGCAVAGPRTTVSRRKPARMDQIGRAGVGRFSPSHGQRMGVTTRDHAPPNATATTIVLMPSAHLFGARARRARTLACGCVVGSVPSVGLG